MPNPTVRANATALPKAGDPLIDICDAIAEARDHVAIAYMAAHSLDKQEASAFHTVLGVASTRLEMASEALADLRASQQGRP